MIQESAIPQQNSARSSIWRRWFDFLSPQDIARLQLAKNDPVQLAIQRFRVNLVGFCALATLFLIVAIESNTSLTGLNKHWLISLLDGSAALICIALAYQSLFKKQVSESTSNLFLVVAVVTVTTAAFINGLMPLMFFTAIMAFTYLLKPPAVAFRFSAGIFVSASIAVWVGNPGADATIYLRLLVDFVICLFAWHFHLCLMHQIIGLYKNALRTRSKFLDTVSHELRAPLNGLNGLMYLLNENLKSSANANQVSKALAYTTQMQGLHDRLTELVDNTLDLNQVRTGHLSIKPEPTDVKALCKDVIEQFRSRCDAKGLTLGFEDKNVPGLVEVDAGRVRQMLHNLLSNAVKFTEQGGVSLSLTGLSQTKSAIALSFQVCDTGIGISSEVERRLFAPIDPFKAPADDINSGFGLSLVRELAIAHGGKYGFHVRPEGGTCFWFEIEGRVNGEANTVRMGQRDDQSYDFRGYTVLVCDDEPINRFIVEQLLGKRGAKLHMAENGRKAVEIVRTLDKPCDLILMDVMMPVVDGFEAMEQIRQVPGWQQIPALCISAVLDNPQNAELAEAVFDDTISKPFRSEELLAKVAYFRLARNLTRGANRLSSSFTPKS